MDFLLNCFLLEIVLILRIIVILQARLIWRLVSRVCEETGRVRHWSILKFVLETAGNLLLLSTVCEVGCLVVLSLSLLYRAKVVELLAQLSVQR